MSENVVTEQDFPAEFVALDAQNLAFDAPRRRFLFPDEIADLEVDMRDALTGHANQGGQFGCDGYGVTTSYSDDDKVYVPINGAKLDILGIMVCGHIVMGDLHATMRDVCGLTQPEVESIEEGWFAHQNPAILREATGGDIRLVQLGQKLAAEFMVDFAI